MSFKPIVIFSWVLGGFGLLFLMLSVAAAYRQVFPPSEHTEQIRGARSTEEIASLLAAVDNLKTWLALALVGTAFLLVASSAPALERWLGMTPQQTETDGRKPSAPSS